MAAEREMFMVCEVKRRRVRAAGGYEPFWKVKSIREAMEDNDTEFRCKDCGGAVKVVKRRSPKGRPSQSSTSSRTTPSIAWQGCTFGKQPTGG